MFGWFKRKKCKEDNAKIEIYEINLNKPEDHTVIKEFLSQILSPFCDAICEKLFQESEKGKKEWATAMREFDKLTEDPEDFNPWHLAALIIQSSIINDINKNSHKKNNVKETRKSPKLFKTKKNSPNKKVN